MVMSTYIVRDSLGDWARTSATNEFSSVQSRPVRMEEPGAMMLIKVDWNSLLP